MISGKNKYNCNIESYIDDITTDSAANIELATLAKALGHPVRVHILKVLAQKQSCICGEIVDLIDGLAQSSVSQHLKILKEAGLIRGEIEGTAVCYCINLNGLKKLRVLISNI